METPRMLFFRGSTPTLELELPLELTDEDTAFLTISQQSEPVLEYAMNATPSPAAQGRMYLCPNNPRLLLVEMAQADTVRCLAGDCELQLRIKTEFGADTFYPIRARVGQMRKEGVI